MQFQSCCVLRKGGAGLQACGLASIMSGFSHYGKDVNSFISAAKAEVFMFNAGLKACSTPSLDTVTLHAVMDQSSKLTHYHNLL
jgi:hypothetical protein